MLQQQMSIEQLSSVDIQTVNREDLIDVSGTTFDNSGRLKSCGLRATRIVFVLVIYASSWSFWIVPRLCKTRFPASCNVKKAVFDLLLPLWTRCPEVGTSLCNT